MRNMCPEYARAGAMYSACGRPILPYADHRKTDHSVSAVYFVV